MAGVTATLLHPHKFCGRPSCHFTCDAINNKSQIWHQKWQIKLQPFQWICRDFQVRLSSYIAFVQNLKNKRKKNVNLNGDEKRIEQVEQVEAVVI
jgi:hypothetical protein